MMADWTPPPAQVPWDLNPPITHGTNSFSRITLRAPTGADLIKAMANPNETGSHVTMRLIGVVSLEEVPFEAVINIPSWQIEQMSNYFETFNRAPMPGPLAEWDAAARAASKSQAARDAGLAPSP
jgi:hypothetical protein